MREAVGEVAVVRQEKRAGRVRIEPPDGNDARRVRDEIDYRAASLRIARGRDDAGRLVEQDVGDPLLRERLPVEADVVVRRRRTCSVARARRSPSRGRP